MSARPIPIALFLAVLSLQLATDPSAAATVVGRVVSSPDGEPQAYTNVVVLGTRRGAQAGEDGRFRITDVPEGTYQIRLQLPGTRPMSRIIEVRGETIDLGDLVLAKPVPPPQVEIGTRTSVRTKDLVATIRSPRFLRVGDAVPTFVVRIENRSDEPVVLVRSVDGSDSFKSPRVTISIEGPPGGFAVRPSVRCGNTNGVSTEDFVTVESGEEFDPYASGWWGSNLRQGSFAKAGTYTATFRYSTMNPDARAWMSEPWSGNELPGTYRDLLAQVPYVELTATTTFEVR